MTRERWARTEELYHAAQALPSSARDAFLDQGCDGDIALRADVASLLDDSHDDEFLLAPVFVLPADLTESIGVADLTGRTIGVYRVDALIGAGGMGDVYRAHDTRLDRVVAIKVLPFAFLHDADRLARLRREARVLAALNHPNICGIHGLEEADGYTFLVLEFVDGETLAERLATSSGRRSPSTGLSLTEALTFAQQIAAALEAAHERGVVHRDLKPANVVVTRDGVAKVLDFGLAKGIDSEGPVGDLTLAPSDAASGGTTAAAVIGTAAYMSAEQAAGRVVDRRSDIWSFGVVLFEMVSGRRPFVGETVTETLASVLKTQPDWSALPPAVTRDLRQLLRRCMEKDPKRRLQSIADARVVIEDILSGVVEQPVEATPPVSRLPNPVPWVLAGALATAWAASLLWAGRPAPPPVTRLEMALPDGRLLDGSGEGT